MLPFVLKGEDGPLLVMLHWLGGSARTWTEVSEQLAGKGFRCTAVDLPGFGEAAASREFAVAAMAAEVAATVAAIRGESEGAPPWLLMGHSMGGKVAAVLARQLQAGTLHNGGAGLEGLAGLVLVSPSPPGPEPMDESQRKKLVERLGKSSGSAAESRSHAEAFVDENVGKLPLAASVRERAVADVQRASREAFVAWLTAGSKEDWSERVGVLEVPALVLAGSEEPALGPEAQKKHTLPHFAEATLVTLEGGGHLGPLERPAELVLRVVEFIEELGVRRGGSDAVLGSRFEELIASDLTSAATRGVLEARMAEVSRRASVFFEPEEWLTLQALVACVLPGCCFDVAARLAQSLAEGAADGWRHDALPADGEAWKKGLRSLNRAAVRSAGVPFVALDGERQRAMLTDAREGKLGGGLLGFLHADFLQAGDVFDAAAMQMWFEDVRAELTKLYVADPRTMERIGFTGFADDEGFTQIRLGEREAWEL